MVQRAVALLLEALYEHDFDDGSDGFRPGRSPHHARQEWRERGMTEGMKWSVDADVRGDVDRMDRTHLRDVRRQRGNEGRRGRLLGTWLRAGGWEEGGLHHPDTGGVPGGSIAPGLAKIFRHQVLEAGWEQEVQPRLQGRSVLSRCAEDLVMGGALAADARQLMAVLPTRVARYGLTIPPTKTALMACRQPAGHAGATPRNGTFDVRGLTHYWALSRRGFWGITRRTARKRGRRPQTALWRWWRAHRHAPLNDHYPRLGRKWRGHLRYDGLPGHVRWLEAVLRAAEKAGRYGRSRRSSTSAIGGEKFQQRRETYVLPPPRIVHHISWARQGSPVMPQSRAGTLAPEEPDAFIAHVRVCGGAGWVTTGSTRKRTAHSARFVAMRVSVSVGCRSPRPFGCRTVSSTEMCGRMQP
jgi:RNA-directed DNA polymerase